MQDHAVGALDLPVRAGVRHGAPVDMDVEFIAKLEEPFPGEVSAVVGDD